MKLSPFGVEHDLLRKTVREWLDSEISPHIADWE